MIILFQQTMILYRVEPAQIAEIDRWINTRKTKEKLAY